MNYVYTKDTDWTCPKQCEHCQSPRQPIIQRPYGANQSSYFCANCGEHMWISQPPGTRAKIEAMLKAEAEGFVKQPSRVPLFFFLALLAWLSWLALNGIIEGVSSGQ